MTDKKIRVGVIGVGSFGRLHALKYYEMHPEDQVELVGVMDSDFDRAETVGEECNCMAFADLTDFVQYCQPDAVSIVTPTQYHFPMAWLCIKRGLDVFVEKPMVEDMSDALELIAMSTDHQRILQVGHIERFNPLVKTIRHDHLRLSRIAPISDRVWGVSVVMDMMIHDIDIALCLFGNRVNEICANGRRIVSDHIDKAWATIEFESGIIVNLHADRSVEKRERTAQVGKDNPFSLVSDADALTEELRSFIHCVRTRKTPAVSGVDGMEALKIALRIEELIDEN